MVIRDVRSSAPATIRGAGDPAASAEAKVTASLQNIVDAMGGPKATVRNQPPLAGTEGTFDYGELTAAEQGDLARRTVAQQLGVDLPATRESLAAVGEDPAIERLFGRSVMTQGDVTDLMKSLGLDVGETLSDAKTVASLKQVQEAFGLPQTGVLDVEMLMALLQAKMSDDRRTPAKRASGHASMKELAAKPEQRSEALTSEQAKAYNYRAGDVTPEKLVQSCPGLSLEKAREVAPHLNQAMQEAGINTPARQAAFIAQLAHESGNFKYSEEIASGRAYEGRRDLGNTQPGDGERFKGRGYIQLTGRANYAAAGKSLGLDLVNHPELAARPENAARIAAWYWNSRGLNAKADAGDFDGITRSINGGYNGKADRDRRYEVALATLGRDGNSNMA